MQVYKLYYSETFIESSKESEGIIRIFDILNFEFIRTIKIEIRFIQMN